MFGIVSAEQRDKMNVLCDITRVFWTCIHLFLILVLSINSPLRKNERSLPLNHHGFYYFLSCVNFLILLASKAPSYYPPHMFAIIISLNFLSSIFFLLLPSFNFPPRFIHIYTFCRFCWCCGKFPRMILLRRDVTLRAKCLLLLRLYPQFSLSYYILLSRRSI